MILKIFRASNIPHDFLPNLQTDLMYDDKMAFDFIHADFPPLRLLCTPTNISLPLFPSILMRPFDIKQWLWTVLYKRMELKIKASFWISNEKESFVVHHQVSGRQLFKIRSRYRQTVYDPLSGIAISFPFKLNLRSAQGLNRNETHKSSL